MPTLKVLPKSFPRRRRARGGERLAAAAATATAGVSDPDVRRALLASLETYEDEKKGRRGWRGVSSDGTICTSTGSKNGEGSKVAKDVGEGGEEEDQEGEGYGCCVCGTTHDVDDPSAAPAFWIQCDGCEKWHSVASACVGFDEEEAASMDRWDCRSCSLDSATASTRTCSGEAERHRQAGRFPKNDGRPPFEADPDPGIESKGGEDRARAAEWERRYRAERERARDLEDRIAALEGWVVAREGRGGGSASCELGRKDSSVLETELTEEGETEEEWDIVEALSTDTDKICMAEKCSKKAVATWADNFSPSSTPWHSCLDCQKRDFDVGDDGWPDSFFRGNDHAADSSNDDLGPQNENRKRKRLSPDDEPATESACSSFSVFSQLAEGGIHASADPTSQHEQSTQEEQDPDALSVVVHPSRYSVDTVDGMRIESFAEPLVRAIGGGHCGSEHVPFAPLGAEVGKRRRVDAGTGIDAAEGREREVSAAGSEERKKEGNCHNGETEQEEMDELESEEEEEEEFFPAAEDMSNWEEEEEEPKPKPRKKRTTAAAPSKSKSVLEKAARPGWKTRYEELWEYKAQHGHCNIPRDWSESKQLSWWVDTQRSQYRLRENGKTSSMTDERIAALERIGFQWCLRTSPADSWKTRLEELREYKARNGHCNISTLDRKNKLLGRWVDEQRKQYRLRQQGKKLRMTDERIVALESLGFQWTTKETQAASMKSDWEKRLQELREYKAQYGHCNVSRYGTENMQLGSWVGVQRTQYRFRHQGKKSYMTDERIAALESIGFQWSIRK